MTPASTRPRSLLSRHSAAAFGEDAANYSAQQAADQGRSPVAVEDSGDSSSMADTVAPCPGVQPAATGSSTDVAAGGHSKPDHAVVTEGTDTAVSAGKGVGVAVAPISDTAIHAGDADATSPGDPADVEQTPISLDAAGAHQDDASAQAPQEAGPGASESLQDGSAHTQQAAATKVMAAQAAAAVGREASPDAAGRTELVTPGRPSGEAASSAVRPEATAAARLGEAGAEASPAVQLPSNGKQLEAAGAEAGTALGAGGGLANAELGAGLIDLQTPGSSSSSSLAPSRIWENNVFSPEVTSRSVRGLSRVESCPGHHCMMLPSTARTCRPRAGRRRPIC